MEGQMRRSFTEGLCAPGTGCHRALVPERPSRKSLSTVCYSRGRDSPAPDPSAEEHF